jgi:hypothetical protein
MLAYDPTQNNTGTGSPGVEGYTSAYLLGASFYRGKDYVTTAANPIIYYCDRVGDSKGTYRLRKQTLNATYNALSGAAVDLVSNSSQILYRPEMTLYGDKRILWYNSAKGYSSFNSWVAETKFIDET